MKFRFFLLLLFYVYSPVAHAQVGFGPEAGIGMSSMRFVPAPEFTSASVSPVLSGRVGGIIDIGLNNRVYIQPGLFLSRKGQNRNFSFHTSDSLNDAQTQTLSIDYVELPINVIFKTGMQGTGRFFLGLGVTPSYILGGKNKLRDQGTYNDTPHVQNTDTRIVKGNPVAMFDIGLSFTAGYEFATGFFLRAYYTLGTNDIGLGGETDKNRMWGIGAGYFFGKGRNINKEADELIDKTPD